MKRILLTISMVFCYLVSTSQENNFTINGDFSNLKEMDSIYMQSVNLEEKSFITITSSQIKNGKFSLSGFIDWEADYYFLVKKSNTPDVEGIRGRFFVEKRTLSYSGEFGQLPVYNVKGSKYAEKIYEYHTDKKYLDLRNKLLEMQAVINPSDDYKIEIQKVQQEVSAFGAENYDWFDETHPKYHLILANQYLNNNQVDKFLEKTSYLIKAFPSHPQVQIMKRLKSILEKQKELESKGLEKKSLIGTNYLDITANTVKGDKIKLSDVLKENKLVLLDFWASWCGPCRAEFPHLRIAYNEYKDKGFEIFAISLDDKDDKWRKALGVEQTKWINTVDLAAFESEAAKKYRVKGIPYNVLIKSDGEIIGESLRGEELEELIHKVLN